MNDRVYTFVEPHFTGGDSVCIADLIKNQNLKNLVMIYY